jgi:predicted homoserine dehydrogenase-like protein
MIIIDQKLSAREAAGTPIQVGLIGAGEMAIGLVNQIERHIPGMRIAAIYNRTAARAHQAYQTAGVEAVLFASTPSQVDDAIRRNRGVVMESVQVLVDTASIDVIVEMTGSIEFAFDVILKAFAAGKHVVSFNTELDATLGPLLQSKARASGVRYTLGDGDEPGVTLNLYRQVKLMGFNPLVCGNIKGMLDHYRNPDTQKGFAEDNGLSVNMVTSSADGTKVSFEQAAIANATGMQVARRGMLAIEYDGHVDDLTSHFEIDQLKQLGGIVEMVIGAQPGPGVFVFASTDDPVSARFLNYAKMGKGPLYSFYVPYHLLFFEFPFSIARLVDFDDGTLDSTECFSVEVLATAKKNMQAGTTLDGLGGFSTYGECENRSEMIQGGFLPIGLANGLKLRNDVSKDQALRWNDVIFDSDCPMIAAYNSIH